MSDISKCFGEGCPLKEKCWRYLAPASFMQSYINPERKEDGSCDSFWNRSAKKSAEDLDKYE